MVQESALTALASVADNAQTAFAKYYDAVLPFLKQILVAAGGKEHRMLRAKAVECISLVGMAVGKERFAKDAKEVMDMLMRLQAGGFENDDETTSYMQQAWTRLCKCLGADFIPYLQVVMPPLLKSAQLKPDVQVTDLEDGPGEEEDEDDEVEVIAVGDKRIAIRTSVLEEKATACNMLCCYVDELKEGFVDYIQPTVATMVPLLDFYFHEAVRKAAVASLPDILRAGKAAADKGKVPGGGDGKQYFASLVNFVVPPLVAALAKEPETEIQAAMLESLADCAGVSGELISAHITSMIAEFQKTLQRSLERRAERSKRADEPDRARAPPVA